VPSAAPRRVALTTIGALAVTAATAAPSSAFTIQTDRSCYNEGQPMAIAGTGFVPGARWDVRTDQIFEAGVTDPLGNWLTTNERAPIVVERTTTFKTFTLTGQQDGVPVAAANFDVVNLFVSLVSPRGKPTGRTRWRFSGFDRGKSIYLHVRRGGKTIANVRMGKADSRCGRASVVQRRLPGVRSSRIRSGSYQYYFDSRSTYSSKTRPQYRSSIFVTRTFR
jgi:hypothetical protein